LCAERRASWEAPSPGISWLPLTPDAFDFVSQGETVNDADRSLVRKLPPDFRTTTLRDGLNSYLSR